MDRDLNSFIKLDQRLVEAAKAIKVLSGLAWPASTYQEFLSAWQAGNPVLPEVTYKPYRFADNRKRLEEIMDACPRGHPLGDYIYKTAESYVSGAALLENLSTEAFTAISIGLFGSPQDSIAPGGITLLDAAEHFILSTNDFIQSCSLTKEEYCVLPTHVRDELSNTITPFFKNHKVEVVIDPNLASKAAAGSSKIRIRGATCFAWMDIPQLIHHEAFVHTLTKINGREQPNFKSFGLGSPRTTQTQEGLALFAEFITTSIDLSRLRRVALRVKAIHLAIHGANFIEIFKFFLAAGQNEVESFYSTMRIFRGGDVRGRVVFTKDVVYLQGLVMIHSFLRKALQEGKINYPHYLFSGRLTLGDVIALEPFFQSGALAPPLYEPQWITNRFSLTAFLLYSSFADQIDVSKFDLSDFVQLNK